MQTREQQYAAQIYQQVSRISSSVAKPDSKKYGSMAHKLPILIRTAGLAQALAFVEARGESPHHQLLDDMAEVVGEGTRAALLQRSHTAGLGEYMRLTQKAMAALLWYKRFAQSVLGVEAGEDEGGSA